MHLRCGQRGYRRCEPCGVTRERARAWGGDSGDGFRCLELDELIDMVLRDAEL